MNNDYEPRGRRLPAGSHEPVKSHEPVVTLGIVWKFFSLSVAFLLMVVCCGWGRSRWCYSQEPGLVREVVKDFFVRQDCNSSNCHGAALDVGGVGGRGELGYGSEIWKQAGEIWFQRDPHSSAYVGLLSQESYRIVRALWPSGDSEVPASPKDPRYEAFLEAKCVACHASEFSPKSQRTLGVDCQSCHGLASAWGEGHYSQDWKAKGELRFEDETAKGRVCTPNIWVLANSCTACHIGDLGRDREIRDEGGVTVQLGVREVTHDLMAAGHPPTYFELGNYLARYPKHWDTPSIPGEDGSDAALDTWRVGKLVSAQRRLELLKERIQQGVVMELTEYRCTSCHHRLEKADGLVGQPEWDGWYLEQVDVALMLSDELVVGGGNSDPEAGLARWRRGREELQRLMCGGESLWSEKRREEILRSCDEMLGVLDRVVENRAALKIPSDWSEIDRRLLEKRTRASWESSVQLQQVLRSIALKRGVEEAKDVRGVYQPSWGLGQQQWRRGEQMPFAGSARHPRDISDWLEQIAETLKQKP